MSLAASNLHKAAHTQHLSLSEKKKSPRIFVLSRRMSREISQASVFPALTESYSSV